MSERRTLHWLEAAGTLDPWRAVIRAEIERGLASAERRVDLPDLDVIIQRVPGGGIPGLGIGAHAHRVNCFSVSFDPDVPAMAAALADGAAARLTVHEAYHCLRLRAIGYDHTLGDALVSEGLAGHFVQECLGTPPEPWEKALDPAALATWLARARQEASALRYDHAAWFFGRGAGAPPRWAGYRLGYHLVGRYLALTPGALPSRLAGLHAARLLRDAWPEPAGGQGGEGHGC